MNGCSQLHDKTRMWRENNFNMIKTEYKIQLSERSFKPKAYVKILGDDPKYEKRVSQDRQ